MPRTALRLDDFLVLQTIGTGSFGTCKKVRRKSDNKVFVWKEIDYGGMTEKEKQLLVQEVNLLRELRHPNIVRYYDRIIDRTESTIYIVMEYCQGGDLAGLIATAKTERRYFGEEFVWKVFHQLLLALEECHRKRKGVHKVLHRDLKPANVFLDESHNVKLGDFGLARILHHNFSLAKTFVGTPYYMSPEQLAENGYDERSDLWSLACLIYELCALVPPFTAPNPKALSVRVKDGRFHRIPSCYSSELQSIIASLLQVEPARRPSIPTLLSKVSTHTRPSSSSSSSSPPPPPPPLPTSQPHIKAQCKPSREVSKPVTARVKENMPTTSVLSAWERDLRQREVELAHWEERLRERERGVVEWRRQLAARERAVREREMMSGERKILYPITRAPLEPLQYNRHK